MFTEDGLILTQISPTNNTKEEIFYTDSSFLSYSEEDEDEKILKKQDNKKGKKKNDIAYMDLNNIEMEIS